MIKDPNCVYAEDGREMFTEYPFFYDGMPAEEFDREQEYYFTHKSEVKSGRYRSLRQQGFFKDSAKA